MVPLWTDHEDGEWVDGKVEVPLRLVNVDPHSNLKLEFNKYIEEHIHKWVDWRRKQGWEITTKPVLSGPFDPPHGYKEQPDREHKWYFLRARFKRTSPLHVKLEDFLEIQRKNEVYGRRAVADPLPYNSLDTGTGDTGVVDPLKFAEERRRRLGIDWRDYQ